MSPQALTQEIITKSFLLSRDFLLIELELETNETLGEECWLKLLKVSEVYLAEEKEYEESRSALDWRYQSVEAALKYLRCSYCQCLNPKYNTPSSVVRNLPAPLNYFRLERN